MIRRVWVLRPSKIALTITALNKIGRSFTPHLPHADLSNCIPLRSGCPAGNETKDDHPDPFAVLPELDLKSAWLASCGHNVHIKLCGPAHGVYHGHAVHIHPKSTGHTG